MRARRNVRRLLSIGAASAAALIMLAGLALVSPSAEAAQRHCQTLLTCNYTKGGTYRGCLSSYSCRQCRFVVARCDIGGKTGTCRKIRCGWGA
ncbi:MAG: hypothetical protein ACT4N2_00575 [Hyphomicrobium sp.]